MALGAPRAPCLWGLCGLWVSEGSGALGALVALRGALGLWGLWGLNGFCGSGALGLWVNSVALEAPEARGDSGRGLGGALWLWGL